MQEEVAKQEKVIAEKEAQTQKLKEQLESLKLRQENKGTPTAESQ